MAEKTSGKSQAKSRTQGRDKERSAQRSGGGGAKSSTTNGTAGGSSAAKGRAASQRSGQQAGRGKGNPNGGRDRGQTTRAGRQPDDQQGQQEQAHDQDQPQEQAGGRLRQAGSTVAGGMQQHPVAAAALGAGLTLLAAQALRMTISRSAQSAGDASGEGDADQGDEDESPEGSYYEDEGDSGMEGDEDADDEGAMASGDEGEGDEEEGGMGSRIGRLGRTGISKVGSALRGGGNAMKRGANTGYERGRELAAGGWQNHPLFMCAAAFAAGAAAGFILPKTSQEDRLMGKSSDKVAGRFKNAASEMFTQGRTIASRALNEAVETTKKEVEREGLSPDRLSKKVKRVVSHVREAVSNAVQEE